MRTRLLLGTFCCFLMLLGSPSLWAQAYQLTPGLDISLGLGSAGMNVGALFLKKSLRPLPDSLILSLNAEDVPRFDRLATSNWRPAVARSSDWVVGGSMLLPLSLTFSARAQGQRAALGLIWLQTFTLNYALTEFVKIGFRRIRPYAYYPNRSMRLSFFDSQHRRRDARLSFYSGHTSTAAAMTFLFAQTYQDLHPGSKATPYVWTAAVLYPAVVGFMRVHAGKHYPTDVLAGLVAGALVGVLIPRLHRR